LLSFRDEACIIRVVSPYIKKLEGTMTRGFAGTNLERKILVASLQGPIHHFMMAF
jgi:hypothetical protein